MRHQRVIERTPSRPAIVERRGESLRIDEGVADALRGDWILVVSSVADERPARTERLTEIIGDASRSDPFLFTPCVPQPSRDGRCRLEYFPDVPLDVRADLLKSAAGPQHGNERQAVVRREAANCLVIADVLLEIVGVESAVIAVIVRRQRWLHVVLRCSDGLGDQRVHTVGANHDAGSFRDGAACSAAPLDAGDSIAVPQQRLHGEPFSQFRTGLDGRIHQQLVQYRAPGAEPAACGVGVGHTAIQRERTDVKEQAAGNWRAAGRPQAIEQTPPIQDLGAMRPDDVSGNGVARKRGPVDQQDPIALPGQPHRCRRAGASRADDDRIVHPSSFRWAGLSRSSNVRRRRPPRRRGNHLFFGTSSINLEPHHAPSASSTRNAEPPSGPLLRPARQELRTPRERLLPLARLPHRT